MDAETDSAEKWLSDTLPDLLRKYDPDNIYNADETGLYFRATPDRTHAHASEAVSGGKKSKERITVLACTNMSGTDTKKLFVIGKSKNPRCFKNITSLPVDYRANKNAWMTSDLFIEWLVEWDRSLQLKKRKILLLVDNCPAHPTPPSLKSIKLMFLPPNTTSIIQPLDQGIIKCLKQLYRKSLCESILSKLESNPAEKADKLARQTTLLDAIINCASAWQKITSATISNCFRKGGFTVASDDDVYVEEVPVIPAPQGYNQDMFEEFSPQDENAELTAELQDADIVAAVRGTNETTPESDNDNDDAEAEVCKPSITEALKSCQTLMDFFKLNGDLDRYQKIQNLQSDIVNTRPSKQASLTNFFVRN